MNDVTEAIQTESEEINPRSSFKFGLSLVVLGVILVTAYLAYKLTLPGPDATALALAANQETVNKVGELIILPEHETPTIVVMTALNIPKDQVFFEHAEVGDQLIMYPLAKRAILYSPKLNKVREAGPLSITPKAPTDTN